MYLSCGLRVATQQQKIGHIDSHNVSAQSQDTKKAQHSMSGGQGIVVTRMYSLNSGGFPEAWLHAERNRLQVAEDTEAAAAMQELACPRVDSRASISRLDCLVCVAVSRLVDCQDTCITRVSCCVPLDQICLTEKNLPSLTRDA